MVFCMQFVPMGQPTIGSLYYYQVPPFENLNQMVSGR